MAARRRRTASKSKGKSKKRSYKKLRKPASKRQGRERITVVVVDLAKKKRSHKRHR